MSLDCDKEETRVRRVGKSRRPLNSEPGGPGSQPACLNRATENVCLSSERRRGRAVESLARFLPLKLQNSWFMSSTFSYSPEAGIVIMPRKDNNF